LDRGDDGAGVVGDEGTDGGLCLDGAAASGDGRGVVRAAGVAGTAGGLAGLHEKCSIWEREAVVASLEKQEPLWKVGTHGYHPRTIGFLADEIVRRVDGRSLGEFWRGEIADEHGIDFWIGLPEGVLRQEFLGELVRPRVAGLDVIQRVENSFGFGMMLGLGPKKDCFGHPGAGGSYGFANVERGMSYGFVMNSFEASLFPSKERLGLVVEAEV